jgi:hypothetical protein
VGPLPWRQLGNYQVIVSLGNPTGKRSQSNAESFREKARLLTSSNRIFVKIYHLSLEVGGQSSIGLAAPKVGTKVAGVESGPSSCFSSSSDSVGVSIFA